jgi:hypothetical protein
MWLAALVVNTRADIAAVELRQASVLFNSG